MNRRLKKVFSKMGKPVLRELAIAKMEGEDGTPCGNYLTPLHGLYCEFKQEACGPQCFNRSLYYEDRCIPALCFARWLVLRGYAKFTIKDLAESIDPLLVRKTQ